MKTKKITKMVYITEDGKEFTDELDAIRHENMHEIEEKLSKFFILDGDTVASNILDYRPMMIDTGFSWYKVYNKDEELELFDLLAQKSGKSLYIRTTDDKFPKYIGYNKIYNALITLDKLQSVFNKKEQSFNELKQKLVNCGR